MNAIRAMPADQFDDAGQQQTAATLGIWVFLATEILFFGVLFASYTICRIHFPGGFAEASRRTDMLLGTIETAVLLTSSALVALAVRDIRLGGRRTGAWLLLATAALGCVFLILHGIEYVAEYREHLVPALDFNYTGAHPHAVEMFFYLYYVITGFHGLHVTVGVCVLVTMALRTWRGAFDPGYHTPLEITALYWHLVDIVWIFVYPLIYLVGRAA
ncbi:MAG TPA: cytochrome c oxidase subunit 3 [Rhodanobacteraceae bacterium]|nr:cytochrome c oxidase subunit 3 [Rhodanobacteraceae bacterium]